MISPDTAAVELDDPSLARPKGWSVRRWLGPVAVGLALFSAFLTFIVLTGLTPIEPKRNVVYGFLLINAATILVLVGIIVREVWKVVQARRRGSAAARLHIQVVSLFSIIAVLPAVIILLAFAIFPLIVSAYLALSRFSLAAGSFKLKFVGLLNFKKLLFGSQQYHFIGTFGPFGPLQWILLAAATAASTEAPGAASNCNSLAGYCLVIAFTAR